MQKKKSKQCRVAAWIDSAKVYFYILVGLMGLYFVFTYFFLPNERDVTSTDCRLFEARWEQQLSDGSTRPVDVPGEVPAKYGEIVRLTTTLPQNIHNDEELCFRPIWQDVNVYVDGKLRVTYNTKDSRLFGTNSAMRYVFLKLSEEDAGKQLTYEFSSESKYAGQMREIFIGNRFSIWVHLIDESGGHTVVSVFLMLMSLFCIMSCFILKRVYKKSLSLKYLAWTLFFSAFWMLSESDFRQIIFRNLSGLSNMTYWCLMIIPIPLLIYLNDVQKGTYRKIYIFPIGYSAVMMVVCTILQVFDIVQFVEMVTFIHTGIILAMMALLSTIVIDIFKKRIGDYVIVSIGIFGMLLTAAIEMILYYVGVSISLGTVMGVGLIFLLVMAVIKTAQDLFRTEQKRREAILAREAQSKFLARMSHEIRTPLNVILGMNEMILRESENEMIQEYASDIQNAGDMLLGLVNDVLDFSKIESGQFELVEQNYELVTLVKDVMLLLNVRAAGSLLSTKLEAEDNMPEILKGDELRIKQILTNLISNAVKYTKEGSVTLKVFKEKLAEDEIELCFSVIDTGIGIKKEDLNKLFDRFKRLELNKNRNIQGTGLGLNIAKQLTELMGGNLTVESQYGKGSTFTLRIPQKVMSTNVVGEAQMIGSVEKHKETKTALNFTAPDASVLVVDDNVVNLSLMRNLLKRTEMRVDLVKSGKDCLKATKYRKYDLIFMDHMMSEMDGVETLKCLREDKDNLNKDSIVIALTANAIAGCRERYLEYGFDDYFSKPIEVNKLDELILKYICPAGKETQQNTE